ELAPSENGGPHKKLYSITDKGRREFSEWLAADPEGRMLLRDPFLTRFVFLDFGEKDRALEIIQGQIDLYEKQLEGRRDNIPRRKLQGPYVSLVADLGVSFNEMYLEWLRRAYREISDTDAAAWDDQSAGRSLID
ncbi:MAG: hypothetical protein ACYC99_11385, partial [Candidatus Geothermincolia bacterium]